MGRSFTRGFNEQTAQFTKEELKHLKYRLIKGGHTPQEAHKRITDLLDNQKQMMDERKITAKKDI